MPKRKSNADSHFDTLFGAKQGEQLASGFKLIPRDKIERNDEDEQEWHSRKILLGLRLCETNPPWRS